MDLRNYTAPKPNFNNYLNELRTELAEKKAYKLNRSNIFKRAHYLVKNEAMNISQALKQCYAEYRAYVIKVADRIKEITKELTNRYSVKKKELDWNEQFRAELKRNPKFNPYERATI